MTSKDVYTHIKIRRDTLENWKNENPILELGEISVVLGEAFLNGIDYDVKLKIGDGTHRWLELRYVNEEVYLKLNSLIKLILNIPYSASSEFKGSVYNYDDLIVNFPPAICKDKDFAYVINDKRFYYFLIEDQKWHPINCDTIGSDITHDEVVRIVNTIINQRLDLDSNSEAKIFTLEEGKKLEERINQLEEQENKDKEELIDKIENIYKKEKVFTPLRINETSGNDVEGNGTITKPFKTILGALNYIQLLVSRTHTNIELTLLSNITLNNKLYLPCINGIPRLTLNGNGYNIIVNNNETNGFEIYTTNMPVIVNNVTFTITGNSADAVYCGMGTKVCFNNCIFNTLSTSANSLVRIDSLSNVIFDDCRFNGIANDNAIKVNDSNIIMRSCKISNVNYGITSYNSITSLEDNEFVCFVDYFNRIDHSEVVS